MKKIIMLSLFLLLIMEQLVAKDDYIELYNAYTNGSRVIVKGRVIDKKDKKTKESKLYSAFFNDEKKEVNVYLEVNKEYFMVHSDNEAYFSFDVKPKVKLKKGEMLILKTNDKTSIQKIQPFFPSLQKHIGVISDFDDTVLISDVTSKGKLLYNTFFKNYKERKIVPEVEEKIKKIIKNNKLQDEVALFFISGSPHQFNNNINNFLDYHNFQKRAILTKKIHGDESASIYATIGYKYDKIVKLLKMYPQVKWVFLGDSGEKDEEIYLKVLKNYSQQVEDIYIRDVESGKVEKIVIKEL